MSSNEGNSKKGPKKSSNAKKQGGGVSSQGKVSDNKETEIYVYSGRNTDLSTGAHRQEKKQGKKYYGNQQHFKSSPSILQAPAPGYSFESNRKAHNVANNSASSSQFGKMNLPHSGNSPHSLKAHKNDNQATMSQKNNSNRTQNHGPPSAHKSAASNGKSSLNFKVLNNVNQPHSVGAGNHFATNCKSFDSGHNRTYNPNFFNTSNVAGKMKSSPHEKLKYPDQTNRINAGLLSNPKQPFSPQCYNASTTVPNRSQQSYPSHYYNASTTVPNRSQQSYPLDYYNASNSVSNSAESHMQNNLNPFLTKFVNNRAVPQSHCQDVPQQHEQRRMQNIEVTIKSPEPQEHDKKKLYQKYSKPNYKYTGKSRHRSRLRRKTKNLEQKKEDENASPLWSFHRAPQAAVENVNYDDSDEETNSSTVGTCSNCSDSESNESSDSDLSEISSEFSLTSIKAKEMSSLSSSSPIIQTCEGFVSTFWDIENCPLPSKISAIDFVKFIRNTFYEGRTEVDFVVACDVSSVNQSVLRELDEASVIVVHISSTSKNAADKKLLTFLQNFQMEHRNEKSAVVLISGDSDFASFLNDMRYKHHIFINLVCKRDSRHSLFEAAHKSVYFEDLIKKLPERTKNTEIQYTVIVSNLPTSMRAKHIKSTILSKIGNKNCRVNMIDKVSARIFYPSLAAREKSLPLLEHFVISGLKIEFTLNEDMDNSSGSRNKNKVHKVAKNTSKENLKHNDDESSCSKDEASFDSKKEKTLHHSSENIFFFSAKKSFNNNEGRTLSHTVVSKSSSDKGTQDANISEGKAASILVHVIENANDVKLWQNNFEKMFGMDTFQLQILRGNVLGNMIIKFKSLSKAQKARKLLMQVEKSAKNSPKFLKLIKHDADLTNSNIDTGIDVIELNRKKN